MKLARYLVRSPLHRPALHAQAFAQAARYRVPSPTKARRFHAYGIGTFRSGTVSLSELFASHYRAAHEADVYYLTRQLVRLEQGSLEDEQFDDWLFKRDAALQLEMESNGYLAGHAHRLQRLFPDARFILTLRHPISWAASFYRIILSNRIKCGHDYWEPLFRTLFRVEDNPVAEEAPLRQHNLYPLRGLFRYWSRVNSEALKSVPPERLLVVRTCELGQQLDAIARHLGIEPTTLEPDKAHSHRSGSQQNMLNILPFDYVQHLVKQECEPLLTQFFPEQTQPNNH